MGFPKKSQRSGRKRKSGGYSTMNDEEKRAYHASATRRTRSTDVSPPPTTAPASAAANRPRTPTKSPGRPPITGVTAMTPTTLRNRKRYLMRQKRKTERRRLIAQRACTSTSNDSPASSNSDSMDTSDDEMSEDEQSVSNLGDSADSISKKYIYRRKCRLRGILTGDLTDSMNLLISFQNDFHLHPDLDEVGKIIIPPTYERYFWHRKKRLNDLFTSMEHSVKIELIKYWLNIIFESPAVIGLFQFHNILIPDSLLPKTFIAARIASHTAKDFLTPSSRKNHDIRQNSIKYIISVAKQANLKEGDSMILSGAVNCCQKFAQKVIKEIGNGSEANLLQLRKTRFDSIHVTEWPSKIVQYVFRSENSRAVPGEETVSVRYGVRKQKHILLRSRNDIAKDFKKEYPECQFGISIIKREFPANAVTATTRDNERNTCPTHANIRRVVKSINKILRKNQLTALPHSCRELCSKVMCMSDQVSITEPVTWNTECVLSLCKECPKLSISVPDALKPKEIKFSLWETQEVLVTKRDKDNNVKSTKKRVFSLYPFKETLEVAIIRLTKMLPNLKRHISTSHKQWQAHDVLRSNMDLQSVITVEDYQMNLEVAYREAPTSMAYSSNKKTVAIYPLCVEYLDDEGHLCKGGIVFLSEDKIHDHQQVEAFEKRAFEIIREEVRPDIKHWKRFSDGAGSQFWSRFVAKNMPKMKMDLNLESMSYDRFEAHEGKSISDTLGSITKCSFHRGVVKEDQGLTSLTDVIDLIRSEMKPSTKKFNFLIIEEFGDTERDMNRQAEKVKNISKLHSFRLFKSKLIGKVWTCSECTVQKVCRECEKGGVEGDVVMSMGSDEEEEELNEYDEELFYDEQDEGQTDLSDSDTSSSDDSESEDVDMVRPGDIVWGLSGRIWYPARICTLAEVPENLKHRFRNTSSKYIAWWYGDGLYSLVTKVEKLGETQIDGKRAARSSAMQKLYNEALADLNL